MWMCWEWSSPINNIQHKSEKSYPADYVLSHGKFTVHQGLENPGKGAIHTKGNFTISNKISMGYLPMTQQCPLYFTKNVSGVIKICGSC